MIDPGDQCRFDNFRPFEGTWLATKPSGTVAYAKMVDGRLLIPYSSDERKLTGHYYDCLIINGILHCRFENFDSASAGVAFLATGPNETLRGGRWANDNISKADKENPSRWSESLPGMQPVVWIRILKSQLPPWAEKYFQEDWPNKI